MRRPRYLRGKQFDCKIVNGVHEGRGGYADCAASRRPNSIRRGARSCSDLRPALFLEQTADLRFHLDDSTADGLHATARGKWKPSASAVHRTRC